MYVSLWYKLITNLKITMNTSNLKKGKGKNTMKYTVSYKAYDDFVARIQSVLASDDEACRQALQLLEASVGYDVKAIDLDKCSIKAQIAFLMIKPEIDKAIKRSQVARSRTVRRKAAMVETIAGNSVTETTVKNAPAQNAGKPSAEEVAEPVAIPHLSRRERRKMKWQEIRKRQKAAMKEKREQREKQLRC